MQQSAPVVQAAPSDRHAALQAKPPSTCGAQMFEQHWSGDEQPLAAGRQFEAPHTPPSQRPAQRRMPEMDSTQESLFGAQVLLRLPSQTSPAGASPLSWRQRPTPASVP